MTSTAVAVVAEEKYPLATSQGAGFTNEFGDDFLPTPDRINVPGAGSTTWEDAQGNAFKELVGVIVAQRTVTRLYLDKPDGSDENNRPDAWSVDGKVQIVPPETIAKFEARGLKPPLTDLSRCPYFKFPNEPGAATIEGQQGGKATREYRELYIVRPGAHFPDIVQIPTSSLTAVKKHFNALAKTDRQSIAGYESVLTLDQQSSGPVKWSTVNFSIGEKISDAAWQAHRVLGDQIRQALQTQAVSAAAPIAQAQPIQAEVVRDEGTFDASSAPTHDDLPDI